MYVGLQSPTRILGGGKEKEKKKEEKESKKDEKNKTKIRKVEDALLMVVASRIYGKIVGALVNLSGFPVWSPLFTSACIGCSREVLLFV